MYRPIQQSFDLLLLLELRLHTARTIPLGQWVSSLRHQPLHQAVKSLSGRISIRNSSTPFPRGSDVARVIFHTPFMIFHFRCFSSGTRIYEGTGLCTGLLPRPVTRSVAPGITLDLCPVDLPSSPTTSPVLTTGLDPSQKGLWTHRVESKSAWTRLSAEHGPILCYGGR